MKYSYALTKTEAEMVEAVRALPQHCRAQAGISITKFVITFHSGMTPDEQAAYAPREAA